VAAALQAWQEVIGSFNYSDQNLLDTYRMEVVVLPSGTGLGAEANPSQTLGGKPTRGSMTIQRGNDINGDGVGDGVGWFLDPTPHDNAEFDGLTFANAYSGKAPVGSPLLQLSDLYSVVLHEAGHALGITDYSGTLLMKSGLMTQVRDANGNLVHDTDAGSIREYVDKNGDVQQAHPGYLWQFNGPSVKHLMTSYNSAPPILAGPNNQGRIYLNQGKDAGFAAHSAPASQSVTINGVTYTGADDMMNPRYAFGQRRLIPLTMALMLKDAYGYTVNLPPQYGTFYALLDSTTGHLLIRGSDNSNDHITVSLSPSGTHLQVSVDIGSDVPGTGPQPGAGDQPAFKSTFSYSIGFPRDLTSVDILGGSGDDTIDIESLPANLAVSVDGGKGQDTVRFGWATGNLNGIRSSVEVAGNAADNDQIWLMDGNNTSLKQKYTISGVNVLLPNGLAAIHYSQIGTINLTAGSANDSTVDVWGTAAGTFNNIYGAAVVNVGKPARNGTLNLSGKSTSEILGALLFGDYVRPMALTIDDSAGTLARTVVVDRNAVYGMSAAPIDFSLALVSTLTVSCGTGGNTVTVARTRGTTATGAVIVNTGLGADTVFVQQTQTPLLINGQRGRDNVTVGITGSVQAINALLTIANSGAWSAVTLDDSKDRIGRSVAMTNLGSYSYITGLAPARIALRQHDLSALDVRLGSGVNNFNVQDTPLSTIVGGALTTVHTGTGLNDVNVYATTGRLRIDSQSLDNQITIGGAQGQAGSLNNLLGDVSVSGVANYISIIDAANAVPYTYTMDAQRFFRTDSFNVSTASISYNQVLLNRLNATMGNGGNYFLINGSPTLSGAPNSGTNFFTGLGDDSVRIRGSNSPLDVNLGIGGNQSIFIGDATTSLDGIRGVVNVFGAGMNVFVSNEASTHAQVATVGVAPGGFGQTFTRQQLNVDHYDTLNTFNFGYLGQASLSYHAGQGGDTMFVHGTPANTTTSLYGGAGQDAFWVETDQPASLGPVTVYGGGTVNELAYYYDYLNPAPQTYTVSNIANPGGPDIERFQRNGAAPVTFSGIQEILFYTPHVGGSTVEVQALPQRMFLNMVNGPGDVVTLGHEQVPGQSRTLQEILGGVAVQGTGQISVILDDSGDTIGRNVVLHPKTSTSADYITGLPGELSMQLDASSSVSILGGQGTDTFMLDGIAFDPAIRIDGGGGTNTLDYSAITVPVHVNLQTGVASGLSGGIANIQNVIGGTVVIGSVAHRSSVRSTAVLSPVQSSPANGLSAQSVDAFFGVSVGRRRTPRPAPAGPRPFSAAQDRLVQELLS
jgi:hypothetical protein